jgi:Holliday junction resolvasome RuvABC ATP-dependent DNA helicase subunit
MLYYDTDSQRQFVREHRELLANEMRQARATESAQTDRDRSRWASELLRRARRLRRATTDQAPVYEG